MNPPANSTAAAPESPDTPQSSAAPLRGGRIDPPSLTEAIASTQPSRYGQIHFNTGKRYVLTDPAVPVPGTAKVKLQLGRRSDDNILGFARENIAATTGNANFVTPIPSAVDFLAVVNDFEALLTAAKNAEMAAKEAMTLKNQARTVLELLFTQRGNYVQTLSLGDPAIIQSAALNVKNLPTPLGTLPPPLGLRVDLNGTVGKMILNWLAVKDAKSYLVQRAIVLNGVRGAWELIEAGGKPTLTLNGMTVGTEYAFRVAAIGGNGGMSDWSPEVIRTAA